MTTTIKGERRTHACMGMTEPYSWHEYATCTMCRSQIFENEFLEVTAKQPYT
jgi:hypothetical protein